MDLLVFENLRANLGSQEQTGIQVSGRLSPGGVLAIQGPSGTGKSTLLRVLGRLEDRFSGKLCWKGRFHEDICATEWRRHIQYVHQDPVTFPGTARDNLLQPWELSAYRSIPRPAPERLASEMAGLGLGEELLERNARLLSGGERARLALLRHLLTGPEILLLDEPTASLDPESGRRVMERLTRWLGEDSRRGICLVSHVGDEKSFLPEKVTVLGLGRKETRP